MGKGIKKIPNKTVSIRIGTITVDKKFSELANECLGASSVNGVNITEMRHRIRIIDQMEKANGEIELEKVDMQVLKKCVSEMQWRFVSPGIIEFVDAIETIK